MLCYGDDFVPSVEKTAHRGNANSRTRVNQDGRSRDERWVPRALIPGANQGSSSSCFAAIPVCCKAPDAASVPHVRRRRNGTSRTALLEVLQKDTRQAQSPSASLGPARGRLQARDTMTKGGPPDSHATHDTTRVLPAPVGCPRGPPFSASVRATLPGPPRYLPAGGRILF